MLMFNPKNAIDGRHMCNKSACVLLGESAEADSTFVSALMTRITCTFSFLAFRYYTDANSAFKRF